MVILYLLGQHLLHHRHPSSLPTTPLSAPATTLPTSPSSSLSTPVMPARKPLFLTVASASAAFSCYLLYILKFVVRRPPRTLAMPPLPTRSAARSNASLPAHLQHVLWRSWATSALCAPAFTSSTSRCSRSPSSNSSTRTTASRCARARRSLDLHVPGRHWWERHVVGR